MRVNPQALGSRTTLRDRFSTRHIAESRVTGRRNATGSRIFGPSRGGHSSGRIDERRLKTRLEPRNVTQGGPRIGPSNRSGNIQRRPPLLKTPTSGNGYRDNRPEKIRQDSHRQPESVNKGFRRPTAPVGYRKPDPRNVQKGMTRQGPRLNDTSGRLGPPPSTKDFLFQGPKKSRPYREEDLKKFKVDIRNSPSPEHKLGGPKEMYDRAELRKFKIDIKGDSFDETQTRRDSQVYLDSHGVPYDKEVLKHVEIKIRRHDIEEENNMDTKTIKRSLELDKFYVPRSYDTKLLNSRNTFQSPRNPEKNLYNEDVKVNIGEVARPGDPPLKRKFEADSFEMYRRPDVSPPRVNRKISLDEQNRSRDRQDKVDVIPPTIHPWADEGSRPVFDNKTVTPNVVRLADFFPSESAKPEKSQQNHSQKYPVRSHSPRSRSYERNRDYNDHKRNPPTASDYHRTDHTSTDFRSRPPSPIPVQEKHRHLLETRRRGADKPRDRYNVERREPLSLPPVYDGYKHSGGSDRNSRRSRSPLPRHPQESPRQRPALSPSRLHPPSASRLRPPSPSRLHPPNASRQRPHSPSRQRPLSSSRQRPPSPKRRALSPPSRRTTSVDDKYRSYERPAPYDDRHRSGHDKPVASEDKYHSNHGKSTSYEDKYQSRHDVSAPFEDRYRDRFEKALYEDKYQSSHDRAAPVDKYRSGHDRPPFEDKYRSGHSKPIPDDKYRSGYERPAVFEDKYRLSYGRPAPFEDKYRTGLDKPMSFDDKNRNDNRRGDSSSISADKYDTARRVHEFYPSTSSSGRGHSPGRGDIRRGGEYRDRSPPPSSSSRHAFSSDPQRGRDYYSNNSNGGDGRVGGGFMQMVPVLPHPPVFAPFIRPLPPGPPHMFRQRK